MKKSIILSLVLFLSFACSKKEDPQPSQTQRTSTQGEQNIYARYKVWGKAGIPYTRTVNSYNADGEIIFTSSTTGTLERDYTPEEPKIIFTKVIESEPGVVLMGDKICHGVPEKCNKEYKPSYAPEVVAFDPDTCKVLSLTTGSMLQ